MSLTDEQKAVVDCAAQALKNNEDEVLMVNAVAGAGKTHMLTEMVRTIPHNHGIYLGYNKSIVTEATKKFPRSIVCLTVNALAYRNTVPQLGLKIGNFSYRSITEKIDYTLKLWYVDTLREFCLSRYTTVEDFAEDNSLTEYNVKIIKKYLELMYTGAIECTHDFYLKLFHMHLSEGLIDFPKQDFLLLDEAGDVNEVILEIFKLLPATVKVAVGDNNQNIYGFNHTINAFSAMQGKGKFFSLTKSFRVSDKIAARIEAFCKTHVDGDMKFTGVPVTDPTIKTRGFISRTNSGLISAIIELNSSDIAYTLIRDPAEIFKIPLILCFLKYQGKISDPAYAHIQDDVDEWYETPDLMRKYKTPISYLQSKYTDDVNLNSAARIVMGYGKKAVFDAYEKAKAQKNRTSNVYLATAHSVKGLEFDEVVIMEDLNRVVSKVFESENPLTEEDFQELNLYYVACSRAKKSLTGATHL